MYGFITKSCIGALSCSFAFNGSADFLFASFACSKANSSISSRVNWIIRSGDGVTSERHLTGWVRYRSHGALPKIQFPRHQRHRSQLKRKTSFPLIIAQLSKYFVFLLPRLGNINFLFIF